MVIGYYHQFLKTLNDLLNKQVANFCISFGLFIVFIQQQYIYIYIYGKPKSNENSNERDIIEKREEEKNDGG